MPRTKKRTYTRQDAVKGMAKTRQKAAREALKTIRTALKHWAALRG